MNAKTAKLMRKFCRENKRNVNEYFNRFKKLDDTAKKFVLTKLNQWLLLTELKKIDKTVK